MIRLCDLNGWFRLVHGELPGYSFAGGTGGKGDPYSCKYPDTT